MLERKIYIFISFIAVALSIALVSCSKEEIDNEMPYITFGLSDIDISTKGLINNELLNSNPSNLRDCVYVYGVKNNTQPIYNKTVIKKEDGSSNWKAQNSQTWDSGSSYSFYGYTSSPKSLSNAPQANTASPYIYVEKEGMKITVSQPGTYSSESNMVDYMLSHAYKVADGTNRPVVMLYMQHAMACTEIKVEKQISEHVVELKSITLKNIYTSAVMESESQAIANSGENNLWKTHLQGDNNASYSKTFTSSPGNTNLLGSMLILAVPQQLTQDVTLEIVYTVDEDNNNTTPATQYTQEFKLYNYRPFVWESGHKVRYTLTINTGVELYGEIVDWIEAGYTEGVIIPSN